MEQDGLAARTSSTNRAKRRKRIWRKLLDALSSAKRGLAGSAVAVDMAKPYALCPYQNPKRIDAPNGFWKLKPPQEVNRRRAATCVPAPSALKPANRFPSERRFDA